MNEIQQLRNQIAELTKRIDALDSVSTIPYQVDKAFKDRGFVKTTDFISGSATLDGSGVGFFEVDAPLDAIALNNRGITSYIRQNTTGGTANELFFTGGDPAMFVNWVIILPTDVILN
jgi:hypothetical protein